MKTSYNSNIHTEEMCFAIATFEGLRVVSFQIEYKKL